jgi:hypothetical protein
VKPASHGSLSGWWSRLRSFASTASKDGLERELGRPTARDEFGEYDPVHEVGEGLGDTAVGAKALQLLGSPRVDEEFLFVDVSNVPR